MLRASIASLLVFAVASAHAKDGAALSSSELAQIKKICHRAIGVPFQDASLAWQFAPFVPNHSELLQPETPCDGHYCSWSAHLRDGTLLVFTFMHADPHFETSKGPPDVTPDAVRKGNNRYVGVALIKKGKVIFSEGHIDSKTSNLEQSSAAPKQTSLAESYNAQVAKIARRAIDFAVSKYPTRLKDASFKLRYLIGSEGKVYNVTVVSLKSDDWVENTAVQALKATTFPPIPKDVRQELRMDYLEEEVDVSYHTGPSTNAGTPAFDKYNLQVHKMLQDEVRPAFATQSRRLEVDYEFYVDAHGNVVNLHAHAKAGGSSAERVVVDSIRTLKCPPVPPQVFKELDQKPPLKIYGTFNWNPNG